MRPLALGSCDAVRGNPEVDFEGFAGGRIDGNADQLYVAGEAGQQVIVDRIFYTYPHHGSISFSQSSVCDGCGWLLDRDGFDQVARMVDVDAASDSHEEGE